METQTVAQRLAVAESQILHGDVQLSAQRALVRHLERNGLPAFEARKVLTGLEEAQAKLVADRDRLEAQEAAPAAAPTETAISRSN